MKFQVASIEYLRYCQFDRNFSEQTMKTRRKRIGYMTMFWLDREIETINLNDILKFKEAYLQRKCKENYINSCIKILICLLKFCKKYLNLQTMDVKEIEFMRVPGKVKDYLTLDEVKELLKYFERGTELYHFRNRALIHTLLDTGMRITECLSLNRSQENDIMSGKCIIMGKFKKERKVFFRGSRDHIKAYLDKRTDDDQALFITHCFDLRWRIKRLSDDGVRKYLREAGRALGFKCNPHKIRRTVLNHWKNNGMDVKSISELAGHESQMVTEKFYLGKDWNILKNKHEVYTNDY